LRLRGGGTKDFLGQSLQGEVLDTTAYSGILSYEPSELVITVRCGTPLTEVEAALAEKGQSFAFEPPHFGDTATVGGMVACGLAGPARAVVGGVRLEVVSVQCTSGWFLAMVSTCRSICVLSQSWCRDGPPMRMIPASGL
jgi:glycolate oxidase FAD binding subunit